VICLGMAPSGVSVTGKVDNGGGMICELKGRLKLDKCDPGM
jgi:hypothetical protein